ncbi:hypothetical protein [Halogeometricum limi]|uniref:Uncharacterized protein n=1 Tax=Halogeometricum limi TaxID=555875 RepID=A0A1I6IFS9_9EURY|nr:hypothetical protein [Halogeometricum limi]SFR65602.1 hypothetical protein SAMN04488124_3212 [Halogeometricum limi]
MKSNSTSTLLLTLVVVTSLLAVPAAAADTNQTATTTETNTTTVAPSTATPTATATETSTPEQTATPTSTPATTEAPTATPESTPTVTEASTATATPDADDASVCNVDADTDLLSQKRLYAQKQVVETGSPGHVAGGFQVAPGVDCDVVVRVTMQVPSGMQISGASDAISGGAGMVSGTFTVDQSSGIKDVRANVYSTNTGERTVIADISYWPAGHPELAQEFDGLTFTFDVESASEELPATEESTASDADADTNTDDDSFGGVTLEQSVIGGLLVVLLAAVVARR